ncbi:hypothetical protein M426DRAFT_325123 [Hypoxylon sp. CI-4A]|nr:hypothetical protein M426DRAFT_325123 [Hypoxylon sp. CI-4A]
MNLNIHSKLRPFITVRAFIATPQQAHIMGIAIGIKSTIFILYQVLTEHRTKYQKWASPKANFILNCIDIPFWGILMGLLFSANGQICTGGACGVSWVMAFLALTLFFLTFWAAIVTYFEYRNFGKKTVRDTSYV